MAWGDGRAICGSSSNRAATHGTGSTIFLVAAKEMMKTHTLLLATFHAPSALYSMSCHS